MTAGGGQGAGPRSRLGRELQAGPYLDRLIELRVFGRKPAGEVPAYSTKEDAAELVIGRLNRPPLRWMSLKDGARWTFHWRKPVPVPPGRLRPRYMSLVSATASTRPLAICRAALKLLGPLAPRKPDAPTSRRRR